MALFDANPKVGYVFGPAIAVGPNRAESVIEASRFADRDVIIPAADRGFLEALLRNERLSIISPTVVIRKECYDKVCYFPADLPHRGDTYVWALIAMRYGVGYLADAMVCYRLHGDSMLHQVMMRQPELAMKDDLDVLWRVRGGAVAFGDGVVVECCDRALGQQIGKYLSGRWSDGTWAEGRPQLDAAGVAAVLASAGLKPKERRHLASEAYLRGGDRAYWAGNRSLAGWLYFRALVHSPGNLDAVSKLGLTKLGSFGSRLRALAGQLRSIPNSPGAGQRRAG